MYIYIYTHVHTFMYMYIESIRFRSAKKPLTTIRSLTQLPCIGWTWRPPLMKPQPLLPTFLFPWILIISLYTLRDCKWQNPFNVIYCQKLWHETLHRESNLRTKWLIYIKVSCHLLISAITSCAIQCNGKKTAFINATFIRANDI